MKKLKIIMMMTISLGLFVQATVAQEAAKVKSDTVKYWVSMDCENCVAKIEKNIAFEKGVRDLKVDLKTKTVTIAYKQKKTEPEKLEKALQELGFKTEQLDEKAGNQDDKKK